MEITSGSLLVNRSKKPTWTNGYIQATTLPTNKDLRIFPALVQSTGNQGCISKTKLRDDAPPAPRPAEQPWEPIGPQDKAYFWERTEAPLPHARPRFIFFTQSNTVLFLNAWSCPFQVKRSCRATRICLLGHRPIHHLGKDRP